MVDRLTERVKEVYTDKVSAFFERVKAMNLTGEELYAVNDFVNAGKKTEAKWIAGAFTKLNGELAWK